MDRSILVPLDGSRFAERALGPAARVAAATGASLHLVRVADPAASVRAYPAEGTGLPPAPVVDPAGGPDAQGYLEGVRERLERPEITRIVTAVLEGSVAASIAHYAERNRVGGLVVATHAPGTVGRVLSGSVADEILGLTTTPLLAVPPEATEPDTTPLCPILVAVDGPTTDAVADTSASLAVALGGRVALVHVVPTDEDAWGTLSHPSGGWDEAMRSGERLVDRVKERMRRRGLDVDVFVVGHNSPAQAICEVAGEVGAGLMAVGSSRPRGLRRLLLGSVAGEVLTSACRPVLIHAAS